MRRSRRSSASIELERDLPTGEVDVRVLREVRRPTGVDAVPDLRALTVFVVVGVPRQRRSVFPEQPEFEL